ncbi:MAG: hypothetical protein K0S65_1054 [Labilithrix sp.]|nr:hypothetical protein [Labilithrix sp.]
MIRHRFHVLFFLFLAAVISLVSSAFAQEMIATGDGIRTKSFGPISVKIYSVRHEMKERPATKSKEAVVMADVDKQLTLRLLRDCPTSKIDKGLRESLALNGYGDQAKINQFLGALDKKEFKENTTVMITYSAVDKTTTIRVQGGGSATVAGPEFMRGVWRIWFGKIDQPTLGDQLIARL